MSTNTNPPLPGPDFSAIDSLAKAEELAGRGELEKLFLMPLQWGGKDIPQNVIYVPAWVVQAKAGIDNNIVAPLVRSRKVSQYSALPEYQSGSAIPIAIRIAASGESGFSTRIAIWGAGLKQG